MGILYTVLSQMLLLNGEKNEMNVYFIEVFLVETKMEAYEGEGLVKDKIGCLLGFGTTK